VSAPTRRDPGWIAVAAGQLTLAVWVVLLAYRDLAGPTTFVPAVLAGSTTGAAVVGVFGFVLPVVLGMFPRLAPGLLGLPRPRYGESLPPALVGLAVSALSLAWLATASGALLTLVAVSGAAAALTLVATIARLGARPRRELRVAATAPFARVRTPANLCLGAGLAYLAVGSALVAVATQPDLRRATGFAGTLAGPLHLVTAGFIVLTVFGIGLRMFSAFSGTQPRPAVAWAVAALGVPAPAGLAFALAGTPPDWRLVAAFGAMALGAASVFAGAVLHMRAHQRRPRAAWWLLAAAAVMLVVGESLGVLFGVDPAWLYLAPVHAQINLLGFAALMIFGVLFELSGAAPARPGRVSAGVAVAAVWPLALLLRLAGYVAGSEPAVAASSLLIAGSLAAAIWDAHPRRGRPPPP